MCPKTWMNGCMVLKRNKNLERSNRDIRHVNLYVLEYNTVSCSKPQNHAASPNSKTQYSPSTTPSQSQYLTPFVKTIPQCPPKLKPYNAHQNPNSNTLQTPNPNTLQTPNPNTLPSTHTNPYTLSNSKTQHFFKPSLLNTKTAWW